MSSKVYAEVFKTKIGIMVWPHVEEKTDNGKYEITLIFKKKSEGHKILVQELKKAEKLFFDGKLPPRYTQPIKDGDQKIRYDKETGKELGVYDGFEDSVYVSLNSGRKPFVVAPDGKGGADPEMVVHGRKTRADVHAYEWEYQGKRGISFGLDSLQISNDLVELEGGGGGNAPDPLKSYDSLEDEDESGDDDGFEWGE